MKKFTIYYFYLLFMCFACGQNSNRTYFTINSDRKIIISTKVADTIDANLIFDTGFLDYNLILDSTFLSKHTSIRLKNANVQTNVGVGWSYDKTTSILYNFPQTLKIGKTSVILDNLHVLDWNKLFFQNIDGFFTIPSNDRNNIWELNFENNYLEIHSSNHFKIPKNCFTVPMYHDLPYMAQLSVTIKHSDGDSLIICKPFLIDTGMPWDIVLRNPDQEIDFFKGRKEAIWLKYLDWYFLKYITKATLFTQYHADSFQVRIFHEPPQGGYFIGLNFLKRFNVFFDLKNRTIGFQPIRNFHYLSAPLWKRFYYATFRNSKGNAVVKIVADYEGNYYKKAGLKPGDEIISVNGKLFSSLSKDEKNDLENNDSLIFNILRNGKQSKLIIPVDKNEKNGD